MTDLTKITTPYGLLDCPTREALMSHGGPYEFWKAWLTNGFQPIVKPHWHADVVYRVAPPTKDTINWDHVADEFICMARDADGETCVYKKEPRQGFNFWYTSSRVPNSGLNAHGYASYKRGTCDWKDSLVFRPGHEPKGEQNDE